MNSTYSPLLSGNVMLIGGTDTGKTSYLQEIILNGFLPSTISKIYWVSGIYLGEERINQLSKSFKEYNPKFTHVSDSDSFNKVISNLKIIPESNKIKNKEGNSDSKNDTVETTNDRASDSDSDSPNQNGNISVESNNSTVDKRLENFIGENVVTDKLVVFDDISKVVEKYGDFAHFLTISRKLGYTCIYIMHSLKAKWAPLMEQTKIFVFFKSAVVTAIMTNFMRDQAVQLNKRSSRTGRKNWLYQVYMDQVQRGSFQSHLLLDIRRLNEKNPPALIRGDTNNMTNQKCYFVSQDNDNDYDTYVSYRINKDTFKIKTSVGKTKFGDRYSLDASKNFKRINADSRLTNFEDYSSEEEEEEEEEEENGEFNGKFNGLKSLQRPTNKQSGKKKTSAEFHSGFGSKTEKRIDRAKPSWLLAKAKKKQKTTEAALPYRKRSIGRRGGGRKQKYSRYDSDSG